ncbi:hypothetical protein ACIQXI_05260 [Lysinibacillus sp. NPDC097195]|uniref:hypothetical protein n=1 Tax=Lysinibacillus sp. NPDC097195 TaxID=3364141 RepID=UPI00381F9981
MPTIHECTTQEKHNEDMKICKQSRIEMAKEPKTRMAVESLVDQFLANGLLRNDRLFNEIFYNKDIIWIRNDMYEGHLFAKACVADELKTKKNGFMMYMPSNPIVYEVNGEAYHLITRIDSIRAKPNLERLHLEAKPILSAARVNDLLCSMVMRFYQIYLEDLTQLVQKNDKVQPLLQYVEYEYAQFVKKVKELNDYHYHWHPRGNGHQLFLQLIEQLQILKSKPGSVVIDSSTNNGYIRVESANSVMAKTEKVL